MQNIFLEMSSRLKEQAGISTDKDLAALIGLSPTSFNQRKARGAFPETELLALTAVRPELKIDVNYVLTGVPTAQAVADMLRTKTFPIPDLGGEAMNNEEIILVKNYRYASAEGKANIRRSAAFHAQWAVDEAGQHIPKTK